MKTYDRATALFWLALAGAVFALSWQMGVGDLGNPGMGFMPLAASGVMGLLALVLLAQTSLRARRAEEAGARSPFAQLRLGRVAGVVAAVGLYVLLLPVLGYFLATSLLLAALLVLGGRRGAWLLITFPGVTAAATLFVFSKLLRCQFPPGILGF